MAVRMVFGSRCRITSLLSDIKSCSSGIRVVLFDWISGVEVTFPGETVKKSHVVISSVVPFELIMLKMEISP